MVSPTPWRKFNGNQEISPCGAYDVYEIPVCGQPGLLAVFIYTSYHRVLLIYTLMCYVLYRSVGKPTWQRGKTSINKEKELFPVIVNIFP
jgi:hypothetical protein